MRLLLLLFCFVFCANAFSFGADQLQRKYNFNSQWLMKVGDDPKASQSAYADQDWQRVTLPRAFNEDEAFRLAIDQHTDTIVWYRKHFKLPAKAENKKIFIEFEGIRFGGEVFVNGKSVGIHENGVMAFGMDITDFVHFGGKENLIALRIDNSWQYRERATNTPYQWNDRNFNANYGGIPKNVYLHITDRLYQTLPLYSNLETTGTYIYARQIHVSKRNAVVHAESEVRNEYDQPKSVVLQMTVVDPEGNLIKEVLGEPVDIHPNETKLLHVADKVENLHFWSWGYGYLYDVYTTLLVDGKPIDRVKTKTGFRKTRFAEGKIWLNDRVIQLKGYAQRTSNEWPAVGMSAPAWLSDYSNRLMVESNANLVRWMHVTPWKQDVESCDRVGLIQAMPAGDAEKDVDGRRWEVRVLLMRDAIIYNRNNPSILFYESGNKGITEEHMAEMKALRDKYDPYGGRAIGSREMLASKIAEYGGEMLYINKSAKKPFGATEYCRDEALRKYWDEYSYPFHKDGVGVEESQTDPNKKPRDMRAYNRNQDSFAEELVRRWYDYFRVRPGTGKRVSSGGAKIIFSDSNTHFRGVENYRRSGVTDPMRIEKDGFFAHQVMWDGWVDVEKHRTHIVGHWNYPENTVKEVLVVSSGEEVELFVNGKSKGMGQRDYHFLFTFKDIPWEAGKIEAVSYGASKEVLSRAEIKTAGEPAALRLTEMHALDGFKADGADLALLQVEVVDKEGNRCPLANDLISFDLQGPAEWRGGIAQGVDNYILSKDLPVECGVNRVLVRSTKTPGKITVMAKATGLTSASVDLETVAFKEKDGISDYISGDHQPLNLLRGETPAGESYKTVRHAVDIVDAMAGSNTDKVAFSYDDNELTEWTNDGTLQNGWIIYELERDAEIAEIEMKLTGWRMRSYPIQVFIDDQEVFNGETEMSLGYISIPITPTKGRFVKIQLKGNSTDNDAFGQIVEITGTKELDLYRDPKAADAKGQLRIIEVEFYEK